MEFCVVAREHVRWDFDNLQTIHTYRVRMEQVRCAYARPLPRTPIPPVQC